MLGAEGNVGIPSRPIHTLISTNCIILRQGKHCLKLHVIQCKNMDDRTTLFKAQSILPTILTYTMRHLKIHTTSYDTVGYIY